MGLLIKALFLQLLGVLFLPHQITSFVVFPTTTRTKPYTFSASVYTTKKKPLPQKLFLSFNNNNDPDFDGTSTILTRFTNPKIDDAGLPLADSLISQIVAPSLQIFWLTSINAPLPTWAAPIFKTLYDTRGSLVAPTLIHGAGLTVCWLMGALAARAFESKAFDARDGNFTGTLTSLIQAGAFATGLLLMSTQLDLFIEFGGKTVQFGESDQSDVRLVTAVVELFNDVLFEGISLSLWRFYRASLTVENNDTPT